jgi:hypothetical protein
MRQQAGAEPSFNVRTQAYKGDTIVICYGG